MGDSEGDNETADCIIYFKELYGSCRAHLTLQSRILVLEGEIFFSLINWVRVSYLTILNLGFYFLNPFSPCKKY